MDFNLVISAQLLRLAPDLQRTDVRDGLIVIKNLPAKTYLRVTPEQWKILFLFEQPRNVPEVLDHAIRERMCLPMGEFFELILKAVRAKILLEPGMQVPIVKAADWRGMIRPEKVARPLTLLFLVGMVMSFGFQPGLPSSVLDVVAGIVILSASYSLATLLTGTVLRGADAEVYHARWEWLSLPPRFRIDASDMIMLPRKTQDVIVTVTPAVLATAAGITTWNRPEWSFVPLLGLIASLRPVFGGKFASVVRLGKMDAQSDAEHDFVFPPNQGPQARWRHLLRSLRQANTWVTLAYGVIWALAVIYLAARLTDNPPWTLEFWETNGLRIATAIGGSLALLAIGYTAWESYLLFRARAIAWRYAMKQWHHRWFGGKKLVLDETERMEAVMASPLLRTLNPPLRQQFVQATQVARFGPWRKLPDFEGAKPLTVGLIVSGRISLRRALPSGRKIQVQTLEAGDVIGLHDVADAKFPNYGLRTLTPVTLLTLPRAKADEIIVQRIAAQNLTNTLLKLPFLRSISVCQNWHLQATERFALLSSIVDYPDDHLIFNEGMFVDRFFIILEGAAVVSKARKNIATIGAGQFFGEIGLLQNSSASATITAKKNTRCLAIVRKEFLRFVTHNFTVALELERVSSKRLKRPIFPLRPGDFSGH